MLTHQLLNHDKKTDNYILCQKYVKYLQSFLTFLHQSLAGNKLYHCILTYSLKQTVYNNVPQFMLNSRIRLYFYTNCKMTQKYFQSDKKTLRLNVHDNQDTTNPSQLPKSHCPNPFTNTWWKMAGTITCLHTGRTIHLPWHLEQCHRLWAGIEFPSGQDHTTQASQCATLMKTAQSIAGTQPLIQLLHLT